ncbi:MAG: tetratricopeptide repeat protein [Candidatus Latescibacterota bacterium]
MAVRGLGGWALALALCAGAARGQEPPRALRVDFLDERMPIPDSERFSESDYTESGVGLSFGVDRRLSYLAGDYEEAVARFEEALKRYRYKSEIWVYLARSYFHRRSPAEARAVLERAAEAMPDLRESFWDPLMRSLLDQIRARANALQVQLDYYAREPGDYLNLFRLYTFVEDYPRASRVVQTVERLAQHMRLLAEGASEGVRGAYVEQADHWQDLAGQLRGELGAAGHPDTAQAASPAPPEPDLLADLRRREQRVDFYGGTPQDYRQLYNGYRALGLEVGAARVLESLHSEVVRLGILVQTAADAAQEAEHEQERDQLQRVLDELRAAAAESTHVGP